MLQQMRALTRNIFAKILLGLLIVGFAIWGINDAFRGMGSNDVAKVGGHSISAAELDRRLGVALQIDRQMAPMQGRQPMTRQQALATDQHRQLLSVMIEELALKSLADRIGVTASNDAVSRAIQSDQNFFNPLTGRFDEGAYAEFLRLSGLSHEMNFEEMRRTISVQQMMESMLRGVRAPSAYGALQYTYETETRTITLAQYNASQLGAIAPPTAEQLQEFYNEVSAQLSVPEFRTLTVIFADPADFTARVTIPEDEIASTFEAARANLSTPARRTFVVLTPRPGSPAAEQEAAARQAATRLAAGQTPSAVAAALNMEVVNYDDQVQADVPDQVLARAIFALPDAERAPQVVRGSLTSWATVVVTAATPGQEASLDEYRDEIIAQLAAQRAAELRDDAITTFHDAIGEGAAPDQAARSAGLRVVRATVNSHGDAPDGGEVAELHGQAQLLAAAFEAEEDEEIDFMVVGENVEAFVHVDSITPQSTRPLDEVRAELIGAWTARERSRRMEAVGQRIIDAVHAGTPFEQAVRAQGARVTDRSQPIDRRTAAMTLPQIFNVREGEAVMGVNADASIMLIAQIEQINRPDLAEQAPVVEQVRRYVEMGDQERRQPPLWAAMQEAILQSAVAAARPRRNEDVIDRTFGATASGDDQAP